MTDREPTGADVREVRGYRVHRFDGVDYLSVSTVLKICRFGELDPGIPAHILEAARQRGQAVGQMIRLHAESKLDVERLRLREEYAALQPFWEQYAAFLKDTGLTLEGAEVLAMDHVTHTFGYVDLLGKQDNTTNKGWAIEIKTGKKLYDSARLQSAAYGMMLDRDPTLLRLSGRDEGYEMVTPDDEDASDFIACAQVAHRYLQTRSA